MTLLLNQQTIYSKSLLSQTVDFYGNKINNISFFTSNIGIGTTIPLQRLHIQGQTYFNNNVGIGTINPIQLLHVQGTTYISNNIGIGINNPLYALQIQGNLIVSGTINTSTSTSSLITVNTNGTITLASVILIDSTQISLTVTLPDATNGFITKIQLLYGRSNPVTVNYTGGSFTLSPATILGYKLIYTTLGWQIIN